MSAPGMAIARVMAAPSSVWSAAQAAWYHGVSAVTPLMLMLPILEAESGANCRLRAEGTSVLVC